MPRRVCALLLLSMWAIEAEAQVGDRASKSEPNNGLVSRQSTNGYCEYVAGVTASDTARLLQPDVFVTAGVFNSERFEESSILPSGRNPARLLAGGEFRFGNLRRALAAKQRAQADCAAYRVSAQLEGLLQNNSNPITTRAVAAKTAVLRDALPEGEAILGATRGFVEVSTATAQEADAIRLRLDELRRILDQTERDAADATPSAVFATVSLPRLMRDVETTQGILETADARVREAAPWDFVVRGGYERIFIASQGRPFFATGTISFNLGSLRQKDADRRAAAGKREWLPEQPDGVVSRTARLIRELRAIERAEADRLQETRVLLSDLQQRMKSVQDVGGRKAKAYADYLWFDYIKLKAENAYLIAHIEDLANLTRDESQ